MTNEDRRALAMWALDTVKAAPDVEDVKITIHIRKGHSASALWIVDGTPHGFAWEFPEEIEQRMRHAALMCPEDYE